MEPFGIIISIPARSGVGVVGTAWCCPEKKQGHFIISVVQMRTINPEEISVRGVKKEYVDEDVLRLIQSHMKAVLDTEKLIREMNSASRNQTQYLLLDKEVGKLRRELSRISKRKSDLYEDYSERLITEEEYMQFSRIYSNEIENIKNRLDVVLAAQVRYSKDYHIEEGWGKVIHTYMSKRKLTKEMADAFVDSIIIHGKYDYEIKLVYDDQFADLQKLKKEKEAQSR